MRVKIISGLLAVMFVGGMSWDNGAGCQPLGPPYRKMSAMSSSWQ